MAQVGVAQGQNPVSGIGSDWTGINKNLLAQVWACDEKGIAIEGDPVIGMVDGAFDLQGSANWQSPFEQSGPESIKPGITAMLQTGSLQSFVNSIVQKDGNKAEAGVVNATLDKLKGRSGMTKLNSVQVYTGSAPLKISTTLFFRAFKDPAKEVEAPLEKLAMWCMPRKLAEGGFLENAIKTIRAGGDAVSVLFPSEVPQMVGITYAGRTFAPLVIESYSDPLGGPKNANGDRIHAKMQLSFGTLTALDAVDIAKIRLLSNSSLRAIDASGGIGF